MIKNVKHYGYVCSIDEGAESKETLYVIRYEDGELEHFTETQLISNLVH